LCERDVERAGQMPMSEFVFRAHIENRCRPGTQALAQFVAGHRFELIAGTEIGRHDARNLRAVALSDPRKSGEQPDHRLLAREPVIDPLAIAAPLDQCRAPQQLQMPRRISEGEACARREILDAALALSKLLEELEAMRMAECLRDLREAGENPVFGAGT